MWDHGPFTIRSSSCDNVLVPHVNVGNIRDWDTSTEGNRARMLLGENVGDVAPAPEGSALSGSRIVTVKPKRAHVSP